MAPVAATDNDYMVHPSKTPWKMACMVSGRRVNDDDSRVREKPARSQSTSSRSREAHDTGCKLQFCRSVLPAKSTPGEAFGCSREFPGAFGADRATNWIVAKPEEGVAGQWRKSGRTKTFLRRGRCFQMKKRFISKQHPLASKIVQRNTAVTLGLKIQEGLATGAAAVHPQTDTARILGRQSECPRFSHLWQVSRGYTYMLRTPIISWMFLALGIARTDAESGESAANIAEMNKSEGWCWNQAINRLQPQTSAHPLRQKHTCIGGSEGCRLLLLGINGSRFSWHLCMIHPIKTMRETKHHQFECHPGMHCGDGWDVLSDRT